MPNQTQAERDAVRNSGAVDPSKFDQEGRDKQKQEVISTEEMATLYIALNGGTLEGADPRAVSVIKAGQEAGNIDAEFNYVGEGEADEG